jgi:putative membrane protein
MTNIRISGAAAALACAVMLSACDTGSDADMMATSDTGLASETAAGTTADGWSDAQIFGLLARINGGRMAAAELAKERATSPEVRELAEMLDREHANMEQRLSSLAQQMNVTPVAPQDSAGIVERNEDLAELQRENAGQEWDREFVDELEDWQEDTKEALTRAIESTASPEFRQALMEMRATVEQHLTQVNALKERLG